MPVQVDGATTIPVKQLHRYICIYSKEFKIRNLTWDHFNHMDPVYKHC